MRIATGIVTNDEAGLPAFLSCLPLGSRLHCWTAAYAISRWLTRPTFGLPARTPSDFGLSWESIHCRTDDGIRLAGWLVTPPRPFATAALFHPVRQDRSHMLECIVALTGVGYRCVAFDHRAHGESGGKRTSFGYHECRDVLAVMDLIRQRWPTQPQVAVGTGMGAAAICFAGSRLKSLSAIVLETFCPDLQEILFRSLGSAVPPWKWQLIHAVLTLTERRLGLRIAQLAPGNHIRDLAPTPHLIRTGSVRVEETVEFLDRVLCRASTRAA
jgi:uncharacterized protein